MITPMRHVTLVARAEDTDRLLAELGALGVVHLVPRPAGGEAIESLHQRLDRLAKLIQKLEAVEVTPGETPTADAAELLARSQRIQHELHELGLLKTKMVRELRAWENFGEIDPELLRDLRRGGLDVRCLRAPPGGPALPDGALWLPGRPGFGIAIGLPGDFDTLSLEEVSLPVRGPRLIRRRLDRLHAREQVCHSACHRMAAALPALRAEQERLREELEFVLAREGMTSDGPLRWIEGFVPEERADEILSAAEAAGVAVVGRKPVESDPTPTLLKQSRIVSWIRPVYDFLGVTPGYTEVDVGWSFLLFLSIFSGMIIGDAGYGIVLTVGVGLLNLLKPATRGRFANLLLCMGVATIVWGLLSGNFFGLSPSPFPALVPAFTDSREVMRLCFTLGAVHLTLAHAWNFVRKIRTPQCLAELGWIGSTWCMYAITGMMVLNEPLPSWVTPLFAACAGMIVLFMTPPQRLKSDWVQHMMLPLSFVNNFVDVVSYVRLYAVGMAGFALANSFNIMILGGETANRNWVASGVMMLVLVLMHGLNFILAGLGVMVHGIRLNTLEFASHIGLTWSGIPYRPFRARISGTDASIPSKNNPISP